MMENKTLSKPIWTRLYEDDLEFMNKLASEQSRTLSQMIRLVVRYYCGGKLKKNE